MHPASDEEAHVRKDFEDDTEEAETAEPLVHGSGGAPQRLDL